MDDKNHDTRERSYGERYSIYMRGWKDGASIKAMADRDGWRADLVEAYESGYGDGRAARRVAASNGAEKYGYTPLIVRAEEAIP